MSPEFSNIDGSLSIEHIEINALLREIEGNKLTLSQQKHTAPL
jgi:hypothetical protein